MVTISPRSRADQCGIDQIVGAHDLPGRSASTSMPEMFPDRGPRRARQHRLHLHALVFQHAPRA